MNAEKQLVRSAVESPSLARDVSREPALDLSLTAASPMTFLSIGPVGNGSTTIVNTPAWNDEGGARAYGSIARLLDFDHRPDQDNKLVNLEILSHPDLRMWSVHRQIRANDSA
jgi:hypothetical protein